MGAFGAFLRGVGGPGLTDLSQSMRRQKEIDDAQAFRAAELQKQREYDEEREMRRLDARGGLGSRRRGGALSAAEDAAERRQQALYRTAERERVSLPEAERMLRMFETGQNELTRTEQVPQQIDDGDRMRTVTTEQTRPDVERFKALMGKIGSYYARAGAETSGKADDLAKSEQTRFGTESGIRAQERPGEAGTLGQGVAVSEGKPPYKNGDNEYTGTLGALSQAKIDTEGTKQQKNKASGAGGSSKATTVQRVITTSDGKAVAVMRDGTTRDLNLTPIDFNKQVASIVAKMSKENIGFSDLPVDEQRARATDVLLGSEASRKPATPVDPVAPSAPTAAPPINLLKEGVRTKFKNGQVWTLKNGKPERVL